MSLPTSQDWYNFGQRSTVRSWRSGGNVASPYHAGSDAAVRGMLPCGDDTDKIKIDLAHTYGIGYGKDEAASAVVFLAIRCGTFGDGTIDFQLHEAYLNFMAWCKLNHKSTSVTGFCKEDLKITSLLGFYTCRFSVCFLCGHFRIFL